MSLFRKKSISDILSESSKDEKFGNQQLKRVLGAKDLIFFGIAAIVGAGSFSAVGSAAYQGGPGVTLLYIFCAIACGFTALCYAEFASKIPVSGSAYTYAYASFGELFAWIIGWALIAEYAIGNIYLSYSWSDYFTGLLGSFHINIPAYLSSTYYDAREAFTAHTVDLTSHDYMAWKEAPIVWGMKFIIDVPALVINIIITILVYIGISESRKVSNAMVWVKLCVLAIVLVAGVFYINTNNWEPFLPNGMSGVFRGVSGVFFAFIGFDAVSTLSEETKNPKRNIPIGIIGSLIISTVIYLLISLVLTGMTSYKYLNVGDPLAHIFEMRGLKVFSFLISVGAVVAMTTVLLVFQLGQPRIWLSMARDGLLPKKFEKIHPKYSTPSFATIMTGLIVGVPILFSGRTIALDFTSIGTLFAFTIVCAGVLVISSQRQLRIEQDNGITQKGFKVPYVNSRYWFSIAFLAVMMFLMYFLKNDFHDTYFHELFNLDYKNYLDSNISKALFFPDPTVKMSTIIFWIGASAIMVLSFIYQWSLIPVLGFLSCAYLLTGMTIQNWVLFCIWLVIGLVIFFSFSVRNSKLNSKNIS